MIKLKNFRAKFGLPLASLALGLSLNATAEDLPLPNGWQTKEIGYNAIAGQATYESDIFNIIASGADIWGGKDHFFYTYKAFDGYDGENYCQSRLTTQYLTIMPKLA